MDSLVMAIAAALDIVENELLGASTNHGKRIAVLCAKMGKILGLNAEETSALAMCALLHDNALTEYILSERMARNHDPAMKKHCEFGQRNVDALNFKTNVKDFILYHHEHADGKGPFGVKAGEGPLAAELICVADSIDVTHHLQRLEPEGLPSIRRLITEETGKHYSKIAADAMLEILDWPAVLSLKDDAIRETTASAFAPWIVDVETETMFGLAAFVAKIIDYKSVFTQRHSTQIANKAWAMGGYYRYEHVENAQLYLAAALHDLGKLAIPTAILEKPDRLTNEEFATIKSHVRLTWEMLKNIEGFNAIRDWASNHHEKLDGSGYSFGKKRDELDFNSRLMVCIDIYQAISEERPYHDKRDHYDTMLIMSEMAKKDEIDRDILGDIDTVMAPYDGGDLPMPGGVRPIA
jgi:HD-GYP domain-containing protein (c-di-GMP phosphodiesterase class II)